MKFASPEWFLLIPALLFIGWFWKSLRLWSPLRLLLVGLAAFGLADPKLNMQEESMDLWVLLDRSDSTEDLVDKGLPEWKALLEKNRPNSRTDEIHLLDYATDVIPHEAEGVTMNRKLTRTGLALSHVAALAKEGKPARVLLFTDGYSTEPLQEAAAQLQARGIPLDYRLIRDQVDNDFRMAHLDFPERVQAGEPFLISALVQGSKDGTVNFILRRNGQQIAENKVVLTKGVGRVEFTDRIPRGGGFQYEAEVRTDPSDPSMEDSRPGNNKIARWIEITGGPRVLLATKYQNDPVAEVLRSQNFTVDVVSDLSKLNAGMLAGAKAVIFNNVPAFEIPGEFLNALDFFVREQGGGFLMAGGKQSFGSGGYFRSSIDPLLPVSMELKNEHRKLAVALAIVMDRSGSMMASVSAGGRNLTKMDMADSGAADAIGLLGQQDQVAVFAVDSEPEAIIPLTTVGGKAAKLQETVRRVKSQGGGIYVYVGLKAAWEELKKTNAGTRHIILFSDANDSEEPGDYKRLMDEMKKEGCTLSVIGMGTKADQDAALLEDIAKRGDGRMFFSDQPTDIPKIFAQETVTIARSAFLDEPTRAQATGRWTEISPKPFDWLPQVDGYNLSYARPDATTSLSSGDEYVAPLVAHARRGLGRTAAVSFPLGGEFSKQIRDWQGYGDFVQTLTRWLMADEVPPGIGIKQKLDGTRMTMDLLYDPEEWSEKFAANPPKLRLLDSAPGSVAYDIPWSRIAPGHFSVSRDLEAGSVVRGAIQVGQHALAFGPVTVGASVEWALDPERIDELRAVSTQTGGRNLVNLAEAWMKPPFRDDVSLRLWISLAALVVLIGEALMTRTGWKVPLPGMPRFERGPAKVREPKAPVVKPFVKEAPGSEPNATPAAQEGEPTERRSRYQRAKDRK